MSLLKRVYFTIFTLIIFTGTVYYLGCSSAESTTGKLAFQQQDYVKAEQELKKGLAIDTKDDEGWYMLGYSQIELGKLKEARESFEKSLAISNLYGDKILALWVDKYNRGAKAFQNGIDAENNKDMSSAKNYFQDALMDFQSSAAIIPDSLKSLSAVGQTYLALGEKDNAITILNDIAAKSTNPEDAILVAKVLFETGLALMQQNSIDAAVGTFTKVTTIPHLPKDNPYYETSAYNLALALAKSGENMRVADENSNYKEKFSEALVYLEPLTVNLKKKDLEPQIYELLVTVYANLDMTDKAKDALDKKNSLQK
ncbi:MAG TPA: tetratricopeptide repeat protein [Ignavibacteria bacterium]|nr:tetratricopeptide repeat protein [Ignavibacteria bacterium]HMR40174.1 tetratricopeptide repeat protein [Ignavibacteria bacterium]